MDDQDRQIRLMDDAELATMPLTFRGDLLAGKVAVVTGGGRGLGKAIAFQLGRLGARIALLGRNADRLNATAAAINRLGVEVHAVPATIRDSEAVAAFVDGVIDRFAGIDIVVNNAGGQYPQAAIDFTPKGWNAVIDTNLTGTWHVMQAAARYWRNSGREGNIVNIVAVVSRGMPGVAHTCAARAGVIALSKTVAIEWAPLGIRVNCVAPGIIATEGMGVYSEEARRNLPESNLMRRFGDVQDIADAVTYLAGPSGKFITGEVLTVDGGNQIWGDQWTVERPAYFGASQK